MDEISSDEMTCCCSFQGCEIEQTELSCERCENKYCDCHSFYMIANISGEMYCIPCITHGLELINDEQRLEEKEKELKKREKELEMMKELFKKVNDLAREIDLLHESNKKPKRIHSS